MTLHITEDETDNEIEIDYENEQCYINDTALDGDFEEQIEEITGRIERYAY